MRKIEGNEEFYDELSSLLEMVGYINAIKDIYGSLSDNLKDILDNCMLHASILMIAHMLEG